MLAGQVTISAVTRRSREPQRRPADPAAGPFPVRKASLMRVMVHPRAGAAAARGHVLGPGAFSVSEEDPSCESIVAADHEIKFGSDNVVIESRNGRWRETLAVCILLHSGNGGIVDLYGNEGDERFRHLVDMTTGRSANRRSSQRAPDAPRRMACWSSTRRTGA